MARNFPFGNNSAKRSMLFFAPKGYNTKAQGNALGQEGQPNDKP